MSVSCLPKIDFVNLDKVCDYVPLISSLSNLVDIFQKCVLEAMKFTYGNEYVQSKYYKHIDNKEFSRCFQLLVPVLGNIYVYLNFIPPVLIETPEDALNFSFSGADWKELLSRTSVQGGDLASLPKDIVSILNSDYAEGQKVKDACILAWFPSKYQDDKALALNLTKLRTDFHIPFLHFTTDVRTEHGETPMGTSGWVLMAKEPLKTTLGKKHEEQKTLIANLGNGWRLPKASEAICFMLMEGQKRDSSNHPWKRTRCQEVTEYGPVLVGGGPVVFEGGPDTPDPWISVDSTFKTGLRHPDGKFVHYGVMPVREL